MFCPQCGADGQKAGAYCKRCGDWLPDMPGIIQRALWGQGIKPEQKIRIMLVRVAVSAALALFSAVALFVVGLDVGNAKTLVYIVAGICLIIFAVQLDGFFVGLRMKRDFKRSRVDSERIIDPRPQPNESPFESPDVTQLTGARGANEATTRRLDTGQISMPEHDK